MKSLRVVLSRPNLADPAFAAAWERDADRWDASAFLRWAWVGCLAAERFPDPLLAEATVDGVLRGRALFNRRRGPLGRSLHLHESGDPALDAVFTEHNGVLAAAPDRPAVLAAILRALGGPATRVVLSGLDAAQAGAAAGCGLRGPWQVRAAPYAGLDPAVPFEAGLSRNARAQLRRAQRSYAEAGPLVAAAAGGVAEALEWLERLLAWHGPTWAARGVSSAFLTPPVQAFHRALLARGGAELVRVSAGPRVVGYLLNLRAGGVVANYQGGFDYAGAAPHEKPGLVCHAAAAEAARTQGCREYDFLAGDARYKRSLATGVRELHWLGWQRGPSLPALPVLARRLLGR